MIDWLNEALTKVFGTYVSKGGPGMPTQSYTEGGWLNQLLGKNKPKLISPLGEYQPTPTPTTTQIPTPTPMATPTPSPRTTQHLEQVPNADQTVQAILAAFPQQEGYNPVNIAAAESSLYPGETGDLGEAGLFQILPSTFYDDVMPRSGLPYTNLSELYDMAANIAVARWLYDMYGWQPWSTAPALGLAGGGG